MRFLGVDNIKPLNTVAGSEPGHSFSGRDNILYKNEMKPLP